MPHITLLMTLDGEREESEEEEEEAAQGRIMLALRFQGKSQVKKRNGSKEMADKSTDTGVCMCIFTYIFMRIHAL